MDVHRLDVLRFFVLLKLVVFNLYNLRMNARRLPSIAFALLLTAACSPPADEADDLIKLATQGASRDAERAARLVEAAGRLPDQPAVQESFYNKDYRTLTPHSGWVLPDKRCVGFGSYLSPTSLHLAELTEITGSGKRLREK